MRASRLAAAIREIYPPDLNQYGKAIVFDPQDLSTLYQDAAGTIPVTGVEQPVGLMLDKGQGRPEARRNLAVYSEDLSNSAWSVQGGATKSGNQITITSAFTYSGIFQYIPPVYADGVSRTFTATFRMRKISGDGRVKVGFYSAPATGTGSALSGFFTLTSAFSTCSFTGVISNTAASGISFSVTNGAATSSVIEIEWAQLKLGSAFTDYQKIVSGLLGEWTPGYHATQSTAASRPTLSTRYNMLVGTGTLNSWDKSPIGSVALPTVVTDNYAISPIGTPASRVILNLNGGTTYGDYARLSFTSLSLSGEYVFSIWMRSNDSTTYNVSLISGIGTSYIATVTPEWNLFSITASGTWTYVRLMLRAGAGINNVADLVVACPSVVASNQSSLPYQSVTSSTVYDSDPSKFPLYLRFTDHWMVTPSIDATAWDKVMVACGLRKMSDVVSGVFLEFSSTISTYNYAFLFAASGANGADSFRFWSKATTMIAAGTGVFAPAPNTSALIGAADISLPLVKLRRNGALVESKADDQGTGNYGNYPLYIGKRAGTTLPFNGYLYGLTVLFPTALPNDHIIQALERHYAAKSGIRI